MSEPWTIARVLDWTRKDFARRDLPSPRLDAEVLIAHALKLRRVELYTRFDQPLRDDELAAVRVLVERRRSREPVAYIVGEREFYGRRFLVDARVLVPRPETEGVVEAALASLPSDGGAIRALDLGTGSGILAITLALERSDLVLDAVDVSSDAIDVARANGQLHDVSPRIQFHIGDLFEPTGDARFSLIVSNPPYIATAEIASLESDVRDYEPRGALDGGSSGDDVTMRVVRGALDRLDPNGSLVVELSHQQAPRILELAHQAGYREARTVRDLAGIERVLIARR